MGSSVEGRRLPAGAEPRPGGGVHFRVWAPSHSGLQVSSKGQQFALHPEGNGYHSALISELGVGDLYRYRLNGDDYPDPASRSQPEGPHGPSRIVDPTTFSWTDAAWKGIPLERAVIYEMHVGTFTPEGTWAAAARHLPTLAELGVNVIEMMPVADFPGRFGWGYDGVNMFAPTRLYGEPDDLRSFINAAHATGIAVILDVVYNHLGADGNYIGVFSPHYFSKKHTTDWGDAINFDGEDSQPVRDYFIANAGYWIREFHFDGLRLDATQNIYDDSEPHILLEISERVRAESNGRHMLLVGENEPQHTRLVRRKDRGGYELDALWNDDLHHTAVVAMTGHNDAYYTDYKGTPQEMVSAMKYGYLYQGQWYKWQNQRRGTSSRGIPPAAFINFIENHDQVANSARGHRMHRLTTPGLYKMFTTLILLGPGTPMLFQGQEFASSKRFLYFADLPSDLAQKVREGRKDFMKQWRTIKGSEMIHCLYDPCDPAMFADTKLDHDERERNRPIWDLHADLLRIRREDPVFREWNRTQFDGAVLSSHAFLLRAFNDEQGDRLLVFNMGLDLHLNPAPEPLLAPPQDCTWKVQFSTEDPNYGGCGTEPIDTEDNWRIPGHAAVVLRGVPDLKTVRGTK